MTEQRSRKRSPAAAVQGNEQRSLGVRIESALDAIEARVANTPVRSIAFGAALATLTIIGGLATFLIVWALLVGVIS